MRTTAQKRAGSILSRTRFVDDVVSRIRRPQQPTARPSYELAEQPAKVKVQTAIPAIPVRPVRPKKFLTKVKNYAKSTAQSAKDTLGVGVEGVGTRTGLRMVANRKQALQVKEHTEAIAKQNTTSIENMAKLGKKMDKAGVDDVKTLMDSMDETGIKVVNKPGKKKTTFTRNELRGMQNFSKENFENAITVSNYDKDKKRLILFALAAYAVHEKQATPDVLLTDPKQYAKNMAEALQPVLELDMKSLLAFAL